MRKRWADSGAGRMSRGAGRPWRFTRVEGASPEPARGRWRNMFGSRRATSAGRAPAGPCSFWRRSFPVWRGCTPAPSGICCAAWGSATNAPSPGSTAPTRTTLRKRSRKLIRDYEQLAQAYPDCPCLCGVQDNWPNHRHAEVLRAVERLRRLELVFLPS